MATIDYSLLNLLPNSSIVGLSNTANSTPAYILPASTVGGAAAQTPVQSSSVSMYSLAPSTVVKAAPTSSVQNGQVSYTIKGGDTLSKIAAQYGTTVSALAAANGITNPNLIIAGKSLVIPSGSPVAAPSTPAAVQTPDVKTEHTQTPAATPATPTPPDASAIATAAGKAGLSVSDYMTLLGGNVAVSSAEHNQIAKDLGISAAEAAAFAKPTQSTQDMYSAAYTSAGLDALHAKILTLIDTINAEKQKGIDAVGQVNENPFLSEKSRVGRGQRVLNQVNATIQNDSDMLAQLQGLYNQGVTEVNNLVARNTSDFKDNQASAQSYLNYLQTKAQQQAETLKSDKTITAAGSVSDFLAGRATAAATQAAKAAPTVIGSAASGYYRWDPTTQSFVQVTKPTGSGGTFSPTAAQKASVAQFLNSDAGRSLTGGATVTSSDLQSVFGDESTFYAILQQASDAGY